MQLASPLPGAHVGDITGTRSRALVAERPARSRPSLPGAFHDCLCIISDPRSVIDEPADLDEHRGMMAQKATELRRLSAAVRADQAALRARQDAVEAMLAAEPATSWSEAAEKARYLLMLFADTSEADDPRRQRLIRNVLADFDRLEGMSPAPVGDGSPTGVQHGDG